MKRIVLIACGSLAVALGILGIFIPIFPQTPFFILAAFCYVRSSERLYNKLLNNRFVGKSLRNYLEYKAISRHSKYMMIALIWAPSILSYIIVEDLFMRIILIIACVLISFKIGFIKTLDETEKNNAELKK